MKRVNVLGAGICGLSVAFEIKSKYGADVEVVITAENALEKTTSYVAGTCWILVGSVIISFSCRRIMGALLCGRDTGASN